jgi:hypothetical protein
MNEDTSSLTTRFWLANEEDHWIDFSLSLSHLTILHFLPSNLCFLFRIFLNVVEFCGIHPSLRKELIVLWKFFLEPF